jgi:hypothetical protein
MALPQKFAALSQLPKTAQITSQKTPKLFTPNSVFSDLGLSEKFISKAIQPNREQALRSNSAGVVLSVFSHVSTWVWLV